MKHALWLLLLTVFVAGCETIPVAPDYGPATGNAVSFGIWAPGARDDCTAAQHDAYSVVGPDHKRYPTWHPPIDPVTGCSFGHDHGRGPRGSALYREVGPIPFGYANEQLDVYDPLTTRHEDHFGHKIEWQNNVPMHFGSNTGGAKFDVHCDVLTKLHQGTHSKDAFTNNLHELVYHIRCTDGTELHIRMLAATGRPGLFTRSCHGAAAAWRRTGTILGITFDDPRSVFDGTNRAVDINPSFVSNARGPEVWFTDPFGKHGQTQSFPGSIRQFIARINNDRGGLELAGPTLGRDREYGGPRGHPPDLFCVFFLPEALPTPLFQLLNFSGFVAEGCLPVPRHSPRGPRARTPAPTEARRR